MTAQTPERTSFDYLILGAGQASIQLAYFLERAGRDYAALESSDTPGSLFQDLPAAPDPNLDQQGSYRV